MTYLEHRIPLAEMAKIIYLFALCVAAVVGLPSQERIVGGSPVDISRYPFLVVLLLARDSVNFRQSCGASIINNRSVLTAAHCIPGAPGQFRLRAGSTTASSGGTVYNVNALILHPDYNTFSLNNDVGIVRLSTAFSFGNNVQVGRIAGTNYIVGDNQDVWAAGWGLTSFNGQPSEILRHVLLWTVNQNTCRNIYGSVITDNILCAAPREAGNGVCSQDSGGPLLHNNVIVGVVSFSSSSSCGMPQFPGGFARVSQYTSWIQWNA